MEEKKKAGSMREYSPARKINQLNSSIMITYIDTMNKNGWDYNAYLEDCKEHGKTPKGEDSNDYYNFVSDMMEMDWSDFMLNLEYSKVNGPVTVHGELGLWWGSPTIEPTKFDDLKSAIVACVAGSTDVKITLDKGILEVVGYHHDGRNYFTIHREDGHFWPKHLF